jgi:chondroitin 4-sulfotransferase 11
MVFMRIIKKISKVLGVAEILEYRQKKKNILQGIVYNNRDLYAKIPGDIIFIHIPKSAGMSFVKALYGKSSSHHAKAQDYYDVDSQKFSKCYSFAITRNPFSRLYSAYNYLSFGGKEAIDKVWRNLYLANYRNFEDFVLHGLNRAIEQNAEHFIPQFRFVLGTNDIMLCDYVGKLEKIESVIHELKNNNIHICLPKENAFGNRVLELDKLYTPEMCEVVTSLYSKDFEIFDYPKTPN